MSLSKQVPFFGIFAFILFFRLLSKISDFQNIRMGGRGSYNDHFHGENVKLIGLAPHIDGRNDFPFVWRSSLYSHVD